MTREEIEMYDFTVECGVCTAEELNLVKNIKGGTWAEVINTVISVRTEYNSYEQWLQEFEEEED